MPTLRITIYPAEPGRTEGVAARELTVVSESAKRLTKARVARLLADRCPGFRRRRGRMSILAGAEILPVLEETDVGWRAWRLRTGDNKPSGYEPPLKGRVGKFNSRGNQFADRQKGDWEQAVITIEDQADAQLTPNKSLERTRAR